MHIVMCVVENIKFDGVPVFLEKNPVPMHVVSLYLGPGMGLLSHAQHTLFVSQYLNTVIPYEKKALPPSVEDLQMLTNSEFLLFSIRSTAHFCPSCPVSFTLGVSGLRFPQGSFFFIFVTIIIIFNWRIIALKCIGFYHATM